ncbi:MAG: hypothetical protein LBJ17_07125 [Dysgonamonadaceae bacterium]|jgi:hypothetical protein|nr:hypothetical protein [Dysgonamonadaceae bacterium]
MKRKIKYLIIIAISIASLASTAGLRADDDADVKSQRLSLGGYGEANYTRNFYSGNPFRYMYPDSYRNDPSHGRFDLPHIVFFTGYEFGNGWRMNSEIEFEHGGPEVAMEIEAEESGEYESETERGGEVTIEQFWIEKTFSRALNVRIGHIVVPVGLTNGNHLPTQFFTVYRPEGESKILPCTWHETGIAVWGRVKDWRYEIQLLPSLDSDLFGNEDWIAKASSSPYEFRVANKYAAAIRVDNYTVNGLRMGVSGYYGHSFGNSLMPTYSDRYKNVKGAVSAGSFDFEYRAHNIISRGYFDYGHLGDSEAISKYNRTLSKASPTPKTGIASDAIATGIEAGYDVLSFITDYAARSVRSRLYIFVRYEYYDSMFRTAASISDEEWCGRQRAVAGVNYFPMRDIVIKAEYSAGILKHPYNDENSVSVGVAYSGFFK